MIQTPDAINGLFEVLSGIALWWNVAKIWRDKKIRGVSILPTLFFTSWGTFNFYFYPHLGQWMSFIGGFFVFASNATWLILAWRYRKS